VKTQLQLNKYYYYKLKLLLHKRQTYAMNFNHETKSPNTCFILQHDTPNDLFGYSFSGKKWQLEILITYANSMEQCPS